MNSISLNKKFCLVVVGLSYLLLIALEFLPFVTNGMWFDDSLNSQIYDMIQRFHSGLGEFSINIVKLWLIKGGRVMLGFFPIYSFFYFLQGNELLIRLADVASTVIHIGMVIYLLKLVHISWRTIGLFVLLLVSIFQIRPLDDPIAAYAIFYQLLGLFITISLILLVKWRQTARSGYLLASTMVAILSLLCYELNIIYFPIAIAVICTSMQVNRLKNLIIVTIPLTLFLVFSYLLRHSVAAVYSGTTLGSLNAFPVTYLKQLTGCLPGSFYIMIGHVNNPLSQLIKDFLSNYGAWLVATLSFLCYFFLIRPDNSAESSAQVPKGVIPIAAAFVLLPPVLMALSERYQMVISWGLPYLPVYYEYFGLALLLAVFIQRYVVKLHPILLILIIALSSLYTTLNWISNKHEAAFLDTIFTEPKRSLTHALKEGLLDVVRDGDIVEIQDQNSYINGNLIYRLTGKNVVVPNEIIQSFESMPREDAIRYILNRQFIADRGYVWQLAIKS
ncbi:MAG: hypothetical protein H0T84_05800 [Tatlockia sp.]|nr:hypothetical protein [Tatlockia sp.]